MHLAVQERFIYFTALICSHHLQQLCRFGNAIDMSSNRTRNMLMSLKVFTKPNCPKCDALKLMLDSKQVVYEAVNLDDEANLQAFKTAYPHVKSVPFVAGNFIYFR